MYIGPQDHASNVHMAAYSCSRLYACMYLYCSNYVSIIRYVSYDVILYVPHGDRSVIEF